MNNAHIVVDQRRKAHTDVGCRRIDAIGEVYGTIATKPDTVDGIACDTHLVVGVVEDIGELAGYGAHEGTEHVVVDEFYKHVVGHIVPGTIAILEHTACATLPVLCQCLVAGHHDNAHVFLKSHS